MCLLCAAVGAMEANTLTPSRRRRVALTGTTKQKLWRGLVAWSTVLAVSAPPAYTQTPNAAGERPAVSVDSSNQQRGSQLLQAAGAALQRNDLATAVGQYREIARLAGEHPALRSDATQLRQALIGRGIDADLLPTISQAPRPVPATSGTQVMQLIAEARLALDRGELQRAIALTNQARAVPLDSDAERAATSAMWQLTLDVDSAARRAGMGAAAGVVQAGAMAGKSNTGTAGEEIRTAGFTSDQPGPAPVTPVQATEDLSDTESPSVTTSSVGERLYREGLEALSAGRSDEAKQLFTDAWKHEATLDPSTRNQLRSKLQLMQSTGSAAANSVAGQLRPLDSVDEEVLRSRQRVYREVTNELGLAYNDRINRPLEALDRIGRLRRMVVDAEVDDSARQTLLAMVDRAAREQQKYVDENRADIELNVRNEQVRMDLENEQKERLETDDLIAEKVELFNRLMKERRFAEAQVVAKQVKEMRPDSTIATQMFFESRTQVRRQLAEEVIDRNENAFVDYLLDAQDLRMNAPDQTMSFMDADEWTSLSNARSSMGRDRENLSPAEREIKRLLTTEVDAKFRNQPLGEVLKTFEMVTGVPIFIDEKALAGARVDSNTPVTLDLTRPISLKSALDLILSQFDLTYAIGNEVLQITTNEVKRGQLQTRLYKVADLVMPIPNFTSSYESGMAGALRAAYQMHSGSTGLQINEVSPVGLAMEPKLMEGKNQANALAQYGLPMMSPNSPPNKGSAGGAAMADFDTLMQLIQTTIKPDTWLEEVSSMFPYAQNLSLVVSTTSEVHDEITQLLEALRRLQNLQVTIEVRFISLADSFFEQIGVDFDVAFDDNTTRLPQDDRGTSVAVGLSGPGRSFTTDLDFRFENNNFNVSPIFGGVDPGALSTFGFAILSDIEAFFFVQAAQGDNRTNVMQAPKVTLFDGQSAMISDIVQRPFVMSLRPVVGDFAVAQQPIIVVLNDGTELNVQAVVSDDKRFVRLTLSPSFTQIGNVDTFTFTGSRSSRLRSRTIDPNTGEPFDDEDEEEITQGTTVQQPTMASTNVQTTVSVPDGGTILLGGIKRLREGRGERGVPILSKLPYINRLFRNTAIGRDAASLMLMVTPRIIIQEEEEIAQTGFDPTR